MCCDDWRPLGKELGRTSSLVSTVFVADPGVDGKLLRTIEFDVFRPLRKNVVVELSTDWWSQVRKKHRRECRRALREVDVSVLRPPFSSAIIATWTKLYSDFVLRKQVVGAAAFSARCLEKQLDVPGSVLFVAQADGRPCGAAHWYDSGQEAFYHLAATSEEGLRRSASYALMSCALEYFSGMVDIAFLGGGLSPSGDLNDGLGRFKRGWSSDSRVSYLCGIIGNRRQYENLSSSEDVASGYFPNYRNPG